jgi:hypothetical protein
MTKDIYLIFILCASLLNPVDLLAQKYIAGGDFDYAPFSFVDKTGQASGLILQFLFIQNTIQFLFVKICLLKIYLAYMITHQWSWKKIYQSKSILFPWGFLRIMYWQNHYPKHFPE